MSGSRDPSDLMGSRGCASSLASLMESPSAAAMDISSSESSSTVVWMDSRSSSSGGRVEPRTSEVDSANVK